MSYQMNAMGVTAGGLALEEATNQRREQLLGDARYQAEKLAAVQTYAERMGILDRVIQRCASSTLFDDPLDVELSLADFANMMWYELRIGDLMLHITIPKPDCQAPSAKYYYSLSKVVHSADGKRTDSIELGRVYEPKSDQIMNALFLMEDMNSSGH